MKNNKKNTKNLIAIIIIVIIIIGFWYYYKSKSNNDSIRQDIENQVMIEAEMENNELKELLEEYENKKYGYLLQYPDYLIVDDIDYSDVVFRDDFQYWQISVIANETNFGDIFDWSEDYKKTLEKENPDIIKIENIEMTIDNNKALAFEIQYKGEIDFYEQDIKRIFVLKDNILYKISTRELDHQKIWDSFKFVD